jgi:hypothetical protein
VVETEDSQIAEAGIKPLAVHDRCFGGEAVLQMNRTCGDRFVGEVIPKRGARREVEADDAPLMRVLGRVRAFATEVKPLLRLFAGAEPDDCGEKHATGHVDPPADVVRRIPGDGQVSDFGDAVAVGAAKLRPIHIFGADDVRSMGDDNGQNDRREI